MTTVFWADATEREITGVVGLISTLEAWHRWWADRWGFRRGLELGAEVRNIVVPFSRSWNAEIEGVVGLICAIYAWHRYCLVQAMLTAAVKAFMRTQGLAVP